MIEILHGDIPTTPVRAVVFDFDGTISTLRFGWEQVMRPLMTEYIAGEPDAVADLVDRYIDQSTGIQTIHQMKWLAEHAKPGSPTDPWWYKDEYNRRLMRQVAARREALQAGADPETYLMAGSRAFLRALNGRGVALYAASGTDHPDVLAEAAALGVANLFTDIAGAPVRAEDCSKERVLRDLIARQGLRGDQLAVIGDGKVEIALARSVGARALGLASDEAARRGVNPVKRKRLIEAGADAIAGDFEDSASLMAFLGLE